MFDSPADEYVLMQDRPKYAARMTGQQLPRDTRHWVPDMNGGLFICPADKKLFISQYASRLAGMPLIHAHTSTCIRVPHSYSVVSGPAYDMLPDDFDAFDLVRMTL